MVEWASLEVVVLGILSARVDFERVEVKEHYALALCNVTRIRPFDMRICLSSLHLIVTGHCLRMHMRFLLWHVGEIHLWLGHKVLLLKELLLLECSQLSLTHGELRVHLLLLVQVARLIVHDCLRWPLRVRISLHIDKWLNLVWHLRVQLRTLAYIVTASLWLER